MPTDFATEITTLGTEFAAAIVRAVRASTVEDLLAFRAPARDVPQQHVEVEAPKRKRGRPRKHPLAYPGQSQSVAEVLEKIVVYVRQHPGTGSAEPIARLSIEKHIWARAILQALSEGRLRKEGQTRSTRYWAA